MRQAVLAVAFCLSAAGPSAGFNLDSLLAKSVGGEEAVARLRAVTTMYADGTALLNDLPGSFEMYVALPNRICQRISLGPMTVTQVFDGRDAWQQDQNGMVSELSGYEERTLINLVYIQTYSYVFDDRVPGGREYLGEEDRNGRRCHKVAFFPMFIDTLYSYFDVESGYQLYDVIYMDNLEVETEYRGHQSHEGVVVAFSSRATVPMAGVSAEMTVETLAFNARVDPAVFTRSASAVDYRFPVGVDSVSVPFRFVAGNIYVQARLNGRLLTFLLDSGSSINVFHQPALDGLDLPVAGRLPVAGLAGYDMVGLVETDSVLIGGLALYSQVGGVLDLSSIALRRVSDHPLGGILGYDFLSRFPILVDYDSETLTVYEPEGFRPPPAGYAVPFQLTLQVPTIDAELVGFSGRYLVDLGNAYGLIVNSEFCRRHGLLERLDDVTDLPKVIGGIGGAVRGKSAYAATFSFGDIRMTDLRIILPDSGRGLSGSVELAGNIGNLLLSQFRVMFDYRGQRLIFYEKAPGKGVPSRLDKGDESAD